MHPEEHPLAGKTVQLNIKIPKQEHVALSPSVNELRGKQYEIEDYFDRIAGQSWRESAGNPACLKYAFRAGLCGLPPDNEVVYGHVGTFGHLVHVSELGEVVSSAE